MAITKVKVQGGLAKGGYEFSVLSCPSIEKYTFNDINEYKIGSDTYFHGYLKGTEIQLKKFPIDANPRKPSPTKVVKQMQATIQKEPEMFHHLNNGITIIATSVKQINQSNEYEISFTSSSSLHGDGICNGGHTYFSLEQYAGQISPHLIVKVEILVLDTKLNSKERADKIKIISETRNAHNQLESSTTAHYSGFYDPFIEALGFDSQYFKWFEGDPNAIKNADKVDSLISKLAAISPHWYKHYQLPKKGDGVHYAAARNKGTVHNNWQKVVSEDDFEKSFYYLAPMIKDILELKDYISRSLFLDDFSQVSKKWRGTRIWKYLKESGQVNLNFLKGNPEGYKLAHTFSTMIVGSFRENIWIGIDEDDGTVEYVGWLDDPKDLWEQHKQDFLFDLNNIAQSISAPSFGNAFLQNRAIYNYQMTKYKYGSSLINDSSKSPQILYKVSTKEKFKLDPNGNYSLSIDVIDNELAPLCDLSKGTSQGPKYSLI